MLLVTRHTTAAPLTSTPLHRVLLADLSQHALSRPPSTLAALNPLVLSVLLLPPACQAQGLLTPAALEMMATGFKEQQGAAAGATDLSTLPVEQQLPNIVQLLSDSTVVSKKMQYPCGIWVAWESCDEQS
jgi:hypothetical protein